MRVTNKIICICEQIYDRLTSRNAYEHLVQNPSTFSVLFEKLCINITEAILLFLYTGVKFVASPTGRTLPKVVKGKLFK